MHTPSPERPSHPTPLSPDNLTNPLAPKQPEQTKQPPTDTSVIGALLGIDAVKQFRASAPATENSQEPKADLPGGELALSAEEAARVNAQEQEQTLEQQARAWFFDLGKDEEWIEEHFNFKDGMTCIASELNLSNCNIAELPSFFKEIRKITHLNLTKNLLTTLKNIPKEIEGDLFLFDNPSLTSCTGLEGIHVGGGLFLFANPKLASLVGLEGVHVGGDLFLSYNPRLASLEGLPPKENIGGSLYLSDDQKRLIQEAREKGYNIVQITTT